MNNDSQLKIENELKRILVDVLELDITPEQLDSGTSLYSPALRMDSLSLLHVIVALEQQFGIEIDDEDVMATDLDNVGSLVGLVDRALYTDTQPSSHEPVNDGSASK
jgi:acyl carrier protein